MKKSEIFRKIQDLNNKGLEFVLITVIETKGSSPSDPGGRMILSSDGQILGTIGGGTLEKLVLKEAGQVLKTGKSVLKKYMLDKDIVLPESEKTGMLCGGEVTLFLEYAGKEDEVFIFGGGHIGKYLINYFKDLSYRIVVIDDRADVLESITNERKILFKDPEKIFDNTGTLNNSYIVIATHSHELDYVILRAILERGFIPAYLGVVASGNKIDNMISRLKREIKDSLNTSFLFSPAGLDIGGRSPSEIALSIIAEIQSIRYEKQNIKNLSKDFRD